MTTTCVKSPSVLGQTIRTLLAVAVLTLLGWAAIVAPGCESMRQHGEYTDKHKSGAKAKMEALKSATEYKMGEQAFLAGDLPKALKHVEYSISLNPNVAKSYVMRGRTLMEMGNLEEAQNSFQQAVKIEPKNVDAEYYQGILAERIDRKDDALTHYQAAAELDASNPQYAIAAAEMMIEAGKIEQAETFLVGRQNTFDHNAGVRQTLGHIAMMKSDPARAAVVFNEAHLLAPDDQGITEDLIRSQMAVGKFAEAEYNLSRILTAKENKARRDLLQMRAACLIRLDRPVEARSILVTLTQGQDGSADLDAWINLGEVAFALHDIPRVKLAANRVVALAPQRPEGYVLRALMLRKSGDLDGAAASIQTAITLKPSAEEYVLQGMILQDLAQNEAARTSYAAALREDPRDPNAGKLLSALESE